MIHLESFQLCAEEFFFRQVLSSIFIIIFPLIGKLCLNIHRHKSRKDCIAAILSCRGQDAIKCFFRLNPETLRKNRLYGLPLIEAKIIDQYKKQRNSLFKTGKYFISEEAMA